MKIIVTKYDDIVGNWVCVRTGGSWTPGRGTTIGLLDTDTNKLVAGAIYEDYNGVNLSVHLAGEPGARWMTREFLWFGFYYPFVQLGCRRITGLVPSSNLAARRLDEHLGYTLEAILKDAHPDGDLLVYVMRKENCRWLNIK